MGANHTVQSTLSEWEIPRGLAIAPNTFIVEANAADQADSFGKLAKMANNLYEVSKAPLLFNRWHTVIQGTALSTAFNTVARWKIPAHKVGTGDSTEKIVAECYMYSQGGSGTTSFQLTTPDATGTSTTTTSSTSTSLTIAAGVAIDDSATDPEVTLEIKNTVNGANARLVDCFLRWYGADSTLPDTPGGTYAGNGFTPMEIVRATTEKETLDVEHVRRLIADVVDTYKRRTPNVILLNWFTAALTDATAGGNCVRCVAFQPPHVATVKVWIYAQGDGATNTTTITHGDQTGTISNVGTGSYAWASTTFAVERHAQRNHLPWDFTVTLDNVSVQGVCAWYETIS